MILFSTADFKEVCVGKERHHYPLVSTLSHGGRQCYEMLMVYSAAHSLWTHPSQVPLTIRIQA